MSPRTIALHSYKGGTGKTTVIANLAALYAKQGAKVCLLDLDLNAPSLSIYFRKNPPLYINDLLNGEAELPQILTDLTQELNLNGKLYVGFANPRKESIQEIELKRDEKSQLVTLKRFLAMRKELFQKYQLDYLFLDTSPGIRYWSVNTLAAADVIFVLMKDSDMDVEGTRRMINDIYDSLTRFGAKYYIILNKVPGAAPTTLLPDYKTWTEELERVVGAQIIGSIPCFCDIQFNRHEYLFSVKKPEHAFSKSLNILAEAISKIS